MSDVAVCIPIFGSQRYRLAGRQAVRSVLQHTDFDVFIAHDQDRPFALKSSRLRSLALPNAATGTFRARMFLRKFQALQACLGAGHHSLVLSLDADAIVAGRIDRSMIEAALDGHDLGMAEQTRIRGGEVGRAELRAHYQNHTLAWFEPGRESYPPPDFRYYNSGVVLGSRDKLTEIAEWAQDRLAQSPGSHQVGQHMIADQDYYQYWVHAVEPGCCATLPWSWNHCRHWDEGFPRTDALILHFSSFCNAPSLQQIAQMALLRRGFPRINRLVEWVGETLR